METTTKDRNKVIKNLAIALLGAGTIVFAIMAAVQSEKNNEIRTELAEAHAGSEKILGTFAEIELNLERIRTSEDFLQESLTMEDIESMESPGERINQEIGNIEQLLAENRALISDLETQIGEKNGKLEEFQGSIASLEKRVRTYKARTEELMAEADALKVDLEASDQKNLALDQALTLKDSILLFQDQKLEEQTASLEHQEKEMRTAYYVVAPFKTLKENEVVEKEGGILGLAATKTVMDDLDKEHFSRIDMYDNTVIPVFGKGVELVSNHPVNSYKVVSTTEGEAKWIEVLDPDRFWDNTQYLVVSSKGSDDDMAQLDR